MYELVSAYVYSNMTGAFFVCSEENQISCLKIVLFDFGSAAELAGSGTGQADIEFLHNIHCEAGAIKSLAGRSTPYIRLTQELFCIFNYLCSQQSAACTCPICKNFVVSSIKLDYCSTVDNTGLGKCVCCLEAYYGFYGSLVIKGVDFSFIYIQIP